MSLPAILDLVLRLRIVDDAADEEALLVALLAPARPTTLAFMNAHAVNLCRARPDTLAAFAGQDVVLRDGSGLKILLGMLGREPGLNMNGTDLIPRILERAKGRRIALWGTRDPHLAAAADRLRAEGHDLVSVIDGFSPVDAYLEALASADPEVIVLAMGMPRQEQLAERLRAAGPRPRLIVSGGAIADFLGGRFSRAPAIFRRTGLEWVYRLALEPGRLASRYLIGNVVFLLLARRLRALAARRGDLRPGHAAAP